ncbi:MAG: imidazoleglycerol-phosphate dehydratase [Armatimonadetes bacterium JP3_11]|jgi:imidazoleglycerol-phosphate dehydratase|nr:MAG: imidazoleglycerol-phosphate dehydratase [Armatimonadetes bacterium CP1_7O]OYT74425.1 MAG: imidazoleglycerol-phosphate dehydratase [Armatimonadetes bacterium JP3_11]RMH07256.1 MAG: imidazoleglycerol-phosphate dehydratase HisB [Armatimonadota bacterium]
MYERETSETRVYVSVDLDGSGNAQINTGIGFFDHMLTQIARHGLIDLVVSATGDLQVDEHHTIEDVGICFGKAVLQALGDMRGISRYGWAIVPMDESLAMVAIDFSGRPLLEFQAQFQREHVGQMPTELVPEFFRAFVSHAHATLHIRLLQSANDHHAIEAIFKAFAKALEIATRFHPRQSGTPSTKGYIEGTESTGGL